MKKPGLVLKIAVLVNAVVLVVAFTGCPSRKESVVPHIAAQPGDFHVMPLPIASPPAHFQQVLPPGQSPTPTQDSRTDQRTP